MTYSPYDQPAQPPPLAYMTPIESSRNDSHIKTLAICHYVWGGLAILGSSCFIFYIVIGAMAVGGAMSPAQSPGDLDATTGWIFIIMGSIAILLGWVAGGLNIYSGVSMSQRRRRTLSLVMAGLNCLSVPLGTTLGVFTFVVLLRDSVVAEYRAVEFQPRFHP